MDLCWHAPEPIHNALTNCNEYLSPISGYDPPEGHIATESKSTGTTWKMSNLEKQSKVKQLTYFRPGMS